MLLSGETDGAAVRCKIFSPENYALYDGDLELCQNGEYLSSHLMMFGDIHPWSNDDPALYHVVMTLYSANGTAVETVPYDIGFRRFELKDGIMLLNGERIFFNGVNRHE